MKPYLKTTENLKDFVNDKRYDFLCTEVRLHGDEPHDWVVFDNPAMAFPIRAEDAEDDIHQRITKAIWDGLGGDKHKTIDHCVYISAAEATDDTFYVNVVRTKPKGAE